MLYLTLHQHIRPRAEGRHLLDEHLAWNHRQQQAGRILASGPIFDRRLRLGTGGMTDEQRRAHEALTEEDRAFVGAIVVRADSLAEAEALLREEPFIRDGFRVFAVFEWEIHQLLGTGPWSREALDAAAAARARLEQHP